MKKTYILFLFFLLGGLFSKAQNGQLRSFYNESWIHTGFGGGTKAILGLQGNAYIKADLVKLFQGKIRLTSNSEAGVGIIGASIPIFQSSYGTSAQLRFCNIYRGVGLGVSTGWMRHTYQFKKEHAFGGWNYYRVSVQVYDKLEIYTSFSKTGDIRELMSFQFGVASFIGWKELKREIKYSRYY